MSNAQTINAALLVGEELIRMLVSSPNGAYFIPSQGYIRPANVPTNLMGLVMVNFYDSEGRETRTRIPITLLGDGTPNGSQPMPQSVLPQTQPSPPSVTQTPLFALPGAAGSVRTAGSPGTALPMPPAAPSPRASGLPPPPPLPAQLQGEAASPSSIVESHHPELGRELLMAQATQLRSLTLQAEEAAGSAIDLEKMSVLRDAHYTREVGEAFQLNSAMRREVFATQTAYQEKAFRQLDLVDVAARRMLRLSDEVVRRVKDPMFQPAPPPLPPPPPPPDYAGIAIAMFQALGRVGAAWSPSAKRRPGRRERQAVLKLLEKAQNGSPDGLKAALDEFAKKGGAGATPESVVEPKQQPDKDNKTFAISKKQLLDLVESGAISALSENGKLAELIHFHNGLAFYRSEQYGPAIVEFRASWELSGERDLLSNLSWACERAGRIPEAKEYAVKYRDLSRGTEDSERSERRVKFLTERYPDGKPGDGKPAEATPPEAKPVPAPSASQLTAQVVQSGDSTPSNGPTPSGRPLAIGLVAGGGATLALAIGLGAGAIATWAEANRSETYYDRWLSLNTTSRALTISAAISGVTGASLLGAGLYLMRRKR